MPVTTLLPFPYIDGGRLADAGVRSFANDCLVTKEANILSLRALVLGLGGFGWNFGGPICLLFYSSDYSGIYGFFRHSALLISYSFTYYLLSSSFAFSPPHSLL